MSPEQFQSDKDLDARSDLFAYGVVYYELSDLFPLPQEIASDIAWSLTGEEGAARQRGASPGQEPIRPI